MSIRIGDKNISKKRCFVIAEAGVNHNGDVDIAKELIDIAIGSGSDAVKFQTFKAEEIVTADAKQAEYQSKNIGKKQSQYEMLKTLELTYDNFRELKKYCDKNGIIFMSTPHSCKEDVDLVSELCPAIKIGSGDLTNIPLLKYVAEKQLPVILSTGMSTLEEVKEAFNTVFSVNESLILLHCTSNYPAPLNEVNLRAIITMEKEFCIPVGYSDQTLGIAVGIAAASLGATVIEKHFTIDEDMNGPDHKASIKPDELKKMVNEIRKVSSRLNSGESWESIIKELGILEVLGDGVKRPMPCELNTMEVARKSIVASIDISKGDVITQNMISVKRPGTGLNPKHYWNVIGMKTKTNIKKDTLISFNDLI